MAMTSQTDPFSSSIPTSTPSPSDSSSPGPTDGGILGNLLTANGSPPLIVAFLAIGLFVVALVGVFGWRRHSRRRVLAPQLVQRTRHKSVAFGKKPILWDLWARVPGLGNVSVNNIEEIRWENIAPLAAVLSHLSPPEKLPEKPSPPIKSTESRHHYHRTPVRGLELLTLAVKRLQLYVLPEPPAHMRPLGRVDTVEEEDDSDTESRSSDVELEWERPFSLGVCVIITMPTERASSSQTPTSEGGVNLEREEVGEYCIGTMDVPWNDGE